MGDICTDNRFKLIEKYKKKLIESTNINSSQDEMMALDNLLFRFWQMGWLDRLEQQEIIRCKDCKHKPFDGKNGRIEFPVGSKCPCKCEDDYYDWKPDADWFCANAERIKMDDLISSKRPCETCRYRKLQWFEIPCDGCTKNNSHYEAALPTEKTTEEEDDEF